MIFSATCWASERRGDNMLSTPWAQRKNKYDFVIIGSGYGGAIAAARLAAANLNPKPSVCMLERGKERQPGEFPETLAGVIGEARSQEHTSELQSRQYLVCR